MTKVFLPFALVFSLILLSSCALSSQKSNLDALETNEVNINEKIKKMSPAPEEVTTPNTKIEIFFTEKKMIGSASSSVFMVKNQRDEVIRGKISFGIAFASFAPEFDLNPGNYQVTVGNLMAENTILAGFRSWGFQVMERPE